MLLMVLNDGRTYTGLEDCRIVAVPDDWQDSANHGPLPDGELVRRFNTDDLAIEGNEDLGHASAIISLLGTVAEREEVPLSDVLDRWRASGLDDWVIWDADLRRVADWLQDTLFPPASDD